MVVSTALDLDRADRRSHRGRRRLPDWSSRARPPLPGRPRPRDAGAAPPSAALARRRPRSPGAAAAHGRPAGRPPGGRPRRRRRARCVAHARRWATPWTLEIAAPAEMAPFLAPKGSIAVDGVSLTVNEVGGRGLLGHAHPAHPGGHPPGPACSRATRSTSRPTCSPSTSPACWTTRTAAAQPQERRRRADFVRCPHIAVEQALERSAPAGWSSWSTTRTARTRAT